MSRGQGGAQGGGRDGWREAEAWPSGLLGSPVSGGRQVTFAFQKGFSLGGARSEPPSPEPGQSGCENLSV